MKKTICAILILFSMAFSLFPCCDADRAPGSAEQGTAATAALPGDGPISLHAISDAVRQWSETLRAGAVRLSEIDPVPGEDGSAAEEREGPRDWSGMPESFSTALDSSLAYIQDYVDAHPNSYAFPVITDVHTSFEWNEPNYLAVKKPELFPVFLFLGDMTNSYTESQFEGAVDYIQGAVGQKKIVSIGNHDFGSVNGSADCWAEGDPLPREWWIPLLESDCVFCEGDNTLTYYWDDVENNVRYIMMDSNSTILAPNGVQRFDLRNLNWLASALGSSGSMDVIVLNHAMGSGFYHVTDTEKETWVKNTGITNINTFNKILLAYKNKKSITILENGQAFVHDFSQTSGDLIGYITGHHHNAGHYDGAGFNKWTCNALTRGGGGNRQSYKGLSFFIVDKDLHKVIFLVVRYLNPDFEVYEYWY